MRHIVALTHQGYDTDIAMAAQLTVVDAIIGGDLHSQLCDFRAVGIASSSGSYPTVVSNKNGELVCIGQAWDYSKAFGLMKTRAGCAPARGRTALKPGHEPGPRITLQPCAGAPQNHRHLELH